MIQIVSLLSSDCPQWQKKFQLQHHSKWWNDLFPSASEAKLSGKTVVSKNVVQVKIWKLTSAHWLVRVLFHLYSVTQLLKLVSVCAVAENFHCYNVLQWYNCRLQSFSRAERSIWHRTTQRRRHLSYLGGSRINCVRRAGQYLASIDWSAQKQFRAPKSFHPMYSTLLCKRWFPLTLFSLQRSSSTTQFDSTPPMFACWTVLRSLNMVTPVRTH